MNRHLCTAIIIIFALLSLLYCAKAQDHHHRPQDIPIHEKFYSTWMMPDNRALFCCHNEDCQPAETQFRNGQVYARQEGDTGDFTLIPPKKIEQERDLPDGRSHLCGRRYGFSDKDFTVFCYIAGNGS